MKRLISMLALTSLVASLALGCSEKKTEVPNPAVQLEKAKKAADGALEVQKEAVDDAAKKAEEPATTPGK